MARVFPDQGAAEYVATGSLTLGDTGTIALWGAPAWNSGDSVQRYLWASSVVDSPSFQRYQDNNIYCGFTTGGNSRVTIADTGLFTSGAFASWVYTWSVAAGQTLYKDAVSKGTASFSSVGSASQQMYIGNRSDAGNLRGFLGSLAEFCFWDVILSAGEIATLARGYSPAFIRLDNIVCYEPMLRANVNPFSVAATIAGTTVGVHPRIIMPRGGRKLGKYTTAAAAPSFIPAWAMGSNLPVIGTGVH